MLNIEQEFGGVNERIHPFLLPPNTFTSSEGMGFRSGKGCRINGKVLSYFFPSSALSIYPFKDVAILQTAATLFLVKLKDLVIVPNPLYNLQDELGNFLQSEMGDYLEA